MKLQGLEAELSRADLQLSEGQANDIVKALQQLKSAVEAAKGLLQQWGVSGRKGLWGAVLSFAFSKQNGHDLLEVSSVVSMH
jgi:hypothetical protein